MKRTFSTRMFITDYVSSWWALCFHKTVQLLIPAEWSTDDDDITNIEHLRRHNTYKWFVFDDKESLETIWYWSSWNDMWYGKQYPIIWLPIWYTSNEPIHNKAMRHYNLTMTKDKLDLIANGTSYCLLPMFTSQSAYNTLASKSKIIEARLYGITNTMFDIRYKRGINVTFLIRLLCNNNSINTTETETTLAKTVTLRDIIPLLLHFLHDNTYYRPEELAISFVHDETGDVYTISSQDSVIPFQMDKYERH